MRQAKLEWLGRAAHFICGDDCRFHLATIVNDLWLVSTVGELWPSRESRVIHAEVHDPKWLAANRHLLGGHFDFAYMQKFGYEQVGCGRLYETMVFRAGKRCARKDCMCGLPELASSELDFIGSNTSSAATAVHHKLVAKYAKIFKAPSDIEQGGGQ